MSNDKRCDNSEIIVSQNQNIVDINEGNGSDDVTHKAESAVTEKVSTIPCDKKNLVEMSASSSGGPSDSSSSDSDTNSSDLDEEENEKEQKWCKKRLREVKKEFYFLKELLYKEKLQEFEERITGVRLGTAKEYQIHFQMLKDQMKTRLELASVLRQYKLENLKHKYEAEEQAIRQSFENDKEILYDTIKANLKEKIQQLEEARNEVDIDASLWLGRSLTRSGRGRGRHPYRPVKPKDKPVIISGPCIVYMLKEHEILEDWTAIKRSLLSSERKENANHRYSP